QQRCFSGMNSNLQPLNRLLFMTFPDKVTAGRISRLAHDAKEAHGLKGNPLRTERFHISLYHFRPDTFALREGLIAQVKRANLEISIPPFELVFDRLLSFSGDHGYVERDGSYALVLLPAKGATELAALHKALAVAVAKAGIKPTCWTHFNPHLTLLYAKDHRIDELVKPI